MAISETTIAFVQDQLDGVGPVNVRRMFGGAGVFCEGVMFALVADDVLYFKVDDATRGDFEAAGSVAFSFEMKTGRKAVMSYWRAPEALFDDRDEMLAWARQALAAARRSDRAKSRLKTAKRAGQKKRASKGGARTPPARKQTGKSTPTR